RGDSSQTAATPSTSTSTKESPAGSSSKGAGATTSMALPAYFVGTTSGTGDRFGLYREFVRAEVPTGATQAQKVTAALKVAMNAQQLTKGESYLQPWSGTSVRDVAVKPSLITVTLSAP